MSHPSLLLTALLAKVSVNVVRNKPAWRRVGHLEWWRQSVWEGFLQEGFWNVKPQLATLARGGAQGVLGRRKRLAQVGRVAGGEVGRCLW